ncbi:MAG TPA: TonB family protein [Gammaproteobacteria bacterium]|jgi:protein TonB|nr:TonB family protein [Gammaproteobacteria bacterium]
MQNKHRPFFREHAIWLSLLAHALFFTSLVVFITLQPVEPKLLPASISAYAAATPPSAPSPAVTPAPSPTPLKTPEKALKKTKDLVEKPLKAAEKPQPEQKQALNKPRVVSFSKASQPIDLTHPFDREPLRLVGESKIVPPLVRILARAIGPHLFYPRVAAEFNLSGVVLVGFVLHPEGYLTDVRIVKSSGAGVLDDAARRGVASVASVGQVSEFVQRPEFLVIGVIFG